MEQKDARSSIKASRLASKYAEDPGTSQVPPTFPPDPHP